VGARFHAAATTPRVRKADTWLGPGGSHPPRPAPGPWVITRNARLNRANRAPNRPFRVIRRFLCGGGRGAGWPVPRLEGP
jgi:hypothetical protein